MTKFLDEKIVEGVRIAAANNIQWHPPLDLEGKIPKAYRWDLCKMRGMGQGTKVWLTDLAAIMHGS